MLIRVMTEVLKGLFEINFNFLEGLDCPLPVADVNDQVVLQRRYCTHFGGWAGPNCIVSAVAMLLLVEKGVWIKCQLIWAQDGWKWVDLRLECDTIRDQVDNE